MKYKTDQLHLVHRGRAFHFVSYEAVPANEAKKIAATPAMWCLMSGGKRWSAIPEVADQSRSEIDAGLIRWLDAHVFARGAATA